MIRRQEFSGLAWKKASPEATTFFLKPGIFQNMTNFLDLWVLSKNLHIFVISSEVEFYGVMFSKLDMIFTVAWKNIFEKWSPCHRSLETTSSPKGNDRSPESNVPMSNLI